MNGLHVVLLIVWEVIFGVWLRESILQSIGLDWTITQSVIHNIKQRNDAHLCVMLSPVLTHICTLLLRNEMDMCPGRTGCLFGMA